MSKPTGEWNPDRKKFGRLRVLLFATCVTAIAFCLAAVKVAEKLALGGEERDYAAIATDLYLPYYFSKNREWPRNLSGMQLFAASPPSSSEAADELYKKQHLINEVQLRLNPTLIIHRSTNDVLEGEIVFEGDPAKGRVPFKVTRPK